MKVTKRRKINDELLKIGFKGELIEVVERDLNHQRAIELKRKLNNSKTKKEAGEIAYWVEEERR